MTLAYDPTGTAPANLVTAEIHTPITEPAIFTEQGPFYESSITITGTSVYDGTLVTLQLYVDFLWSPMFSIASADTGKTVYSYIVLTNYLKWSRLSVTYHGVGGNRDNILLAEIVAAGNFDRTNIDNWLAFQGDVSALNMTSVDYSLKNTGIAYLFARKLDAIAIAMRTPSTYAAFITGNYTSLRNDVNSLQAAISSWSTSFTNNGIFDGNWATITYVTSAITTAINSATSTITSGFTALIRKRVLGALIIYISPTGNDANDGLSNSTPFATIQHGIDYILNSADVTGAVTLQLMDGTHTGSAVIYGYMKNIYLTIQGNSANPEIVQWSVGNKSILKVLINQVFLQNMVLTAITGTGIQAQIAGEILIGPYITFGQMTGAHMTAYLGGSIKIQNQYRITGGASAHYLSQGGTIQNSFSGAIVLTNIPEFTGAFAIASFSGSNIIAVAGSSFSGVATGIKYTATINSAIVVNAAGINYFPGDAAGTTATGGLYL